MGYYKWADKQLEQLKAENPSYTRSQFPGMQLGLANQTFNSRQPGAARFQQNTLSSQGNTLDFIGKNSSDASQAMLMGAGVQGQTNQVLGDLQLQETDWKKFGLQNLNDAYSENQKEDMYGYEKKMETYQNKVQLQGAQAANKLAKRKALWNTVGGIANFGVNVASAAATGGFGPAVEEVFNKKK